MSKPCGNFREFYGNEWAFDRVRAIHRNVTAEAGDGLTEEQAIAEATGKLKKATGQDPEKIEVLGFRNGCLVHKPAGEEK